MAAGWGFARIDPASIQADNGAGLTRGVIDSANKGQPRWPEDWGALRAWAWSASRGLEYGASDARFGAKTANDIPVDAHELIPLCAPHLTFISYGIPEKGHAHWLDHQGSYMATVAAQPVWEFLGAKGIGPDRDYRPARMHSVNIGLLDGQLALRQHDGGHTDAPNMKYFIQWADKNIGHIPPP